MDIRDYLQKKKLVKLRQEDPTTYLEGLIERKISAVTAFFQESIDAVKLDTRDFVSTVNTAFESKKEELSSYIHERTEQVLEICIQRIDTYLKNNKPEKGDKGDSYILTEEDKQAIANAVPVVEKVIEKHYTVVKGKNETPIVVKAVTDTGEEIAEKLNTTIESVSIRVVRGLYEELESIKKAIRRKGQTGGGGDIVEAGTGISITEGSGGRKIISSTVEGSSSTKGIAEVDFGAVTQNNDIATVSVADTSITATSYPVVALYAVATTDHDSDDYMAEALSAYVSSVTAGVGFDISVRAPSLTWGKYKVTYMY